MKKINTSIVLSVLWAGSGIALFIIQPEIDNTQLAILGCFIMSRLAYITYRLEKGGEPK